MVGLARVSPIIGVSDLAKATEATEFYGGVLSVEVIWKSDNKKQ